MSTLTAVAERRAARRCRRLGPCVVYLVRDPELPVWGLTDNLSRRGVGLALRWELPAGTPILVKKSSWDDTRPLFATVVRTARGANAWYHGCRLSEQLTEAELAAWFR